LAWKTNMFGQGVNYEDACSKECSYLTKACTAYIECSVAKAECQESCMQRRVWENVAGVLERLTVVLEKQAMEKQEKEKNPQPSAIVSPSQYQNQNVTESKSTVSDSAKSDSAK
jgi:hypothetical protein